MGGIRCLGFCSQGDLVGREVFSLLLLFCETDQPAPSFLPCLAIPPRYTTPQRLTPHARAFCPLKLPLSLSVTTPFLTGPRSECDEIDLSCIERGQHLKGSDRERV